MNVLFIRSRTKNAYFFAFKMEVSGIISGLNDPDLYFVKYRDVGNIRMDRAVDMRMVLLSALLTSCADFNIFVPDASWI